MHVHAFNGSVHVTADVAVAVCVTPSPWLLALTLVATGGSCASTRAVCDVRGMLTCCAAV